MKDALIETSAWKQWSTNTTTQATKDWEHESHKIAWNSGVKKSTIIFFFQPTSVALKRINLFTASETQRKWLDREINILNDPDLKRHPNVVKYIEYFIHSNFLCIVMDFYEGGTLYSYIRKKKPISESIFMEFFEQITQGLEVSTIRSHVFCCKNC